MAGKKGSSPSVYKYFKVDGDKVTRKYRFDSRCRSGDKIFGIN